MRNLGAVWYREKVVRDNVKLFFKAANLLGNMYYMCKDSLTWD